MRWPKPLRPATFIRRENRFRASIELDGEVVAAHVPNSGRLGELFTAGARVWVVPWSTPGRKTACDLTLVEYAGTYVSVDARLPNRLVAEALAAGRLAAFTGYPAIRQEIATGDSRLDFLLTGPGGRCWLETKSVTLVVEGSALFPDAPTGRGVRHLAELSGLVAAGDRAAVLFVVQRDDAAFFEPHPTADTAFAEALRRSHEQGVEIHAWRCTTSLDGIALLDPITVRL